MSMGETYALTFIWNILYLFQNFPEEEEVDWNFPVLLETVMQIIAGDRWKLCNFIKYKSAQYY